MLLVAVLVFVFLWGSLSNSATAQHDIELDLNYSGAVNGIQIRNSTCSHYTCAVNNSFIYPPEVYTIGYEITNKGLFNESVISHLLIKHNITGEIVLNKTHTRSVDVNESVKQYDDLNTSSLALGLYNLSVEAVIINTSNEENITDDNISDNLRVRQVNLVDNNPPFWVENLSNQIIERNQPFNYDVNASDDFFVDRYWINDSSFFEINSSTGVLTNKTGLPFRAYHLNITVNDSSGNKLSTEIKIEVTDLTPPELTIHQPGNQTFNQKIPLNLSATDTLSNLSTLWYTLDGIAEKHILWNKSNSKQLNHSSNITNVWGGKHTLQIYVNDSYGNTKSEEIELTLQAQVNASRFIQELTALKHIKSASLLDAGNNTINYSGNESIPVNNTFTLLLRLDSNTTVKIPSFSGLDMNWNQAHHLKIINLSDSCNWVGEMEDLLGVEYANLLYFNNTEKLLADQDYLSGAVIQLDWNLSSDLQIIYLPCEQEPVILKECNDAGETMCYLNTSNNLTIRLPHLSGAALWTDTAPPIINITMPGNNTILNDSIPPEQVFKFRVKETNPDPESFCRYILESGDGIVKEGPTDASESFLDETYTITIEGLLNGFYNFTVNCSDVYGKTSTLKHGFLVNDTTPPVITYFDVDVDHSSSHTSARVDLEARTNEKSTCRYDTKDRDYDDMDYELDADDSGTTHTQRHSKKYTKDTSGDIYVQCRDLNGNDAVNGADDDFTVNIWEEDDDDDDDDDDTSSGSSSATYSSNTDEGSCFDLIENCHDGACEKGIDCGGPCMPCPSCSDRRQNQGETGVDCGGPCLPCTTTTYTTTTTTTTTTLSTTTSTSSTTTSTQKIIYEREKKEKTPAVTGMVAGFDLFSTIISFIVLTFLLLIAGISVYAFRNASVEEKPPKKGSYEIKSTRRGTRLGDV